MNETTKADTNGKNRSLYNPVSLGTLYFSFSLVLWSGVFWLAITSAVISFIFFISVFSERILKFWSKIVTRFLIPLTFVVFVGSFTIGVLQTVLQESGITLEIVMYFSFAWIVVFLLIVIRPKTKQPGQRKNRMSSFTSFLPYTVVVLFLIIAVIKFFQSHDFWDVDFWSGIYSIIIAGLALSVARNWLKVHGEVFELPDC